jgi:hypothetical protein
MKSMKHFALYTAVTLAGVAGVQSTASAQLLTASRCQNAFGVSSTTAQARYAWGLFCMNACKTGSMNCPPDATGVTPRPYTAFLTDQSVTDYNTNPDLQPFLFPTYFDFVTFGAWDIPDTAYPPATATNNCFALPTSAINAGLCVAGCYTPETALQFADGPMGIKDAALASKVDLLTLAPTATLDNLQTTQNQVQGYTTDMREGMESIHTLTMASGGQLRVTREHPLITGDGVIRQAQRLEVGDQLVRADGKKDPIVSIEVSQVFGKVYNVKPVTTDFTSNIVIAGGYLNGSERFQNEFLSTVNALILRRGLGEQADRLTTH